MEIIRVVAPHFGYESAMDYYTDAQIVPNVHKFPIPVFGLNALDDPFSPEEGKQTFAALFI